MRTHLIILLILYAVVCVPAKLGAQADKKPSDYKAAYIGTFSSVSVITKDTALFNDTLTQIANFTYDSVILAKVKYIQPMHTLESLSIQQLQVLTTGVTKTAIECKRSNNIKAVTLPPILDSIASNYDNRYTSYFINYGNIWSKKQHRKYIAGRTLLVTAAVIGFAVLIVILAPTGGSNFFTEGLFANDDTNGERFFGMNCYYMVYDKQEKQICYMIGAQFRSDKTDNNPFNPTRVEKQIESLFYLPH